MEHHSQRRVDLGPAAVVLFADVVPYHDTEKLLWEHQPERNATRVRSKAYRKYGLFLSFTSKNLGEQRNGSNHGHLRITLKNLALSQNLNP